MDEWSLISQLEERKMENLSSAGLRLETYETKLTLSPFLATAAHLGTNFYFHSLSEMA